MANDLQGQLIFPFAEPDAALVANQSDTRVRGLPGSERSGISPESQQLARVVSGWLHDGGRRSMDAGVSEPIRYVFPNELFSRGVVPGIAEESKEDILNGT